MSESTDPSGAPPAGAARKPASATRCPAASDLATSNSRSPHSAEDAAKALAALNEDLARLQRTIRMAITEKLQSLEGCSFGSLQANRDLVATISKLLDSHGLRIRCPQCGHPSILRVSPSGKTDGLFVFDHTIDGRRTFHGGKASLPLIRLVAKPPRRGKQNKIAS